MTSSTDFFEKKMRTEKKTNMCLSCYGVDSFLLAGLFLELTLVFSYLLLINLIREIGHEYILFLRL